MRYCSTRASCTFSKVNNMISLLQKMKNPKQYLAYSSSFSQIKHIPASIPFHLSLSPCLFFSLCLLFPCFSLLWCITSLTWVMLSVTPFPPSWPSGTKPLTAPVTHSVLIKPLHNRAQATSVPPFLLTSSHYGEWSLHMSSPTHSHTYSTAFKRAVYVFTYLVY